MKECKFIAGYVQTISDEIDQYLRDGWEIRDTHMASNETTINFTKFGVVLVRDVPEEPKTNTLPKRKCPDCGALFTIFNDKMPCTFCGSILKWEASR